MPSVDKSIACQSCMFRPSHHAGYAPDCDECWVAYIVALIERTDGFGADADKVRDRVFEELAKRRK